MERDDVVSQMTSLWGKEWWQAGRRLAVSHSRASRHRNLVPPSFHLSSFNIIKDHIFSLVALPRPIMPSRHGLMFVASHVLKIFTHKLTWTGLPFCLSEFYRH
jgi:hypothetical protein